MRDAGHLPLPYLLIDGQYQILSGSAVAHELFGTAATLLDLLDPDSRTKCQRLIHPHAPARQVELHLRTRQPMPALFDVYQTWVPQPDDNYHGHLLLVATDDRLQAVTRQMHVIRQALHNAQPADFHPPAVDPAADAATRRDLSALSLHLSTVRDLLHVVQPALVESGRDLYVQLCNEELRAAEQLLKQLLR